MTKRRVEVVKTNTGASSAPITTRPAAAVPTSIEVRRVVLVNEMLSDIEAVAAVHISHIKRKTDKAVAAGDAPDAGDIGALLRAQMLVSNNEAEKREQAKNENPFAGLDRKQLIEMMRRSIEALEAGE